MLRFTLCLSTCTALRERGNSFAGLLHVVTLLLHRRDIKVVVVAERQSRFQCGVIVDSEFEPEMRFQPSRVAANFTSGVYAENNSHISHSAHIIPRAFTMLTLNIMIPRTVVHSLELVKAAMIKNLNVLHASS